MGYVYMGIFSTVFNWVLNKIFSPVFNFVAGLLSDVLSWIFNNILAPLLEEILWPLIQEALWLLVKILAGILYSLYAKILSLVDLLCQSFDILIGLTNVTYNGKPMTLLDAMFSIKELQSVYWVLTAVGLTLATALAIYATIKSTIDLDFENKRPVSRVLSAFFKSFIQLFTVQFFIIFMVRLSGIILKGINTAMYQFGGSSKTTLGAMVFVVSSFNASKNSAWNLGGANESKFLTGVDGDERLKYYNMELSYTNKAKVEEYFDLAKFDYVIGIALAVFLLVIMASCLIVFVQRIFDMLTLYLVSPFFVGMIPLDDGEKFASWRSLFIGKCFSGFGMVMAMKMYLMLCPLIMSSKFKFTGSTEFDYLTKMVFLLGGAWAVLKSGPMITSLISSEAGSTETQTAQAGAMGVAALGKGAVSMTKGAYRGAKTLRDMVNTRKTNKLHEKQQRKQEHQNKIDAIHARSASGENGLGTSGDTSSLGASGGLSGLGTSGGTSGAGASGGLSGLGASGGTSGLGTSGGTSGAGTSRPTASQLTPRQRAINANKKPVRNNSMAPFKTSFNPATGKREFALRPGKGKFLNIGKDGQGNFNLQLLGFGVRWGKDGKVNKVTLPMMRLKRNNKGELDFAKVSVMGVNCKYNSRSGKMELKDISLIGLHRKKNADGDYEMTRLFGGFVKRKLGDDGHYHLSNLGGNFIRREQGADGEYHLTNFGGNLVKREMGNDGEYHLTNFGGNFIQRKEQENGSYELTGIRILGLNFYGRDEDQQSGKKGGK